MASDKELSTNDEVNRSEDFQKKVSLKETIIDFLKSTLVSVTDSIFQKAGYKKNTTHAGEYGDGTKYGAGAIANQYIVNIAGKTKTVLTKKIIMDGKSISSDIEVNYKDNVVEIVYLTTEQGFFRGVDKNGKTYTINERMALDSSDMTKFKSELKNKLEGFAERELGYLTSTKLGVADKSDKSTASVVENNNTNMKKLTIKELFEMDFDSTDSMEPNSDKIKGLNTVDLKNTTPPIDNAGNKKLFFDDNNMHENDWIDGENIVDEFQNALKEVETQTNGALKIINVQNNNPEEIKASVLINNVPYEVICDDDGYGSAFMAIDNFPIEGEFFHDTPEALVNAVNNDSVGLSTIKGTDFSMNEVSTSGPAIADSPGGYKDGAASGAGGYNTKYAWKKTPYAKGQQKRPKVTHEYKVVAEEEKEEESNSQKSDSNEKKSEKQNTVPANNNKKSSTNLPDVTPKSPGKDMKPNQPANKNSAVEEPESDANYDPKTGNPTWKNTNQSKAPKSSNDDFWTEVDLIPGTGYVPKGMDQNYVAGMHDRMGDLKKMGLGENKKPDLTKKKFFSLNENKEKGINKRYLITEKTTEEFEKERWKKLSLFKTRETIKEAEEMNNFFDALQENKDPNEVFTFKKSLTENISYDDLFEDENKKSEPMNEVNQKLVGKETVEVEKPGSTFKLTYKFLKEDFENTSKRYIVDINSNVFVINPNFGKK